MELEVAEQCVVYLGSVRSYEKVSHNAVAMSDIKKMYSQLRGRTQPNNADPQLISGVLQCALKDLSPCLLHNVYDDLIAFDTLDDKDGILKLTTYIRSTLSKLPQRHFALFQRLCEVLCKSAQNASCAQLAANMSPYICRPLTGAFMSIRHMDDLRRIRPAVQFVLENYAEVFDRLASTEQQTMGPRASNQSQRVPAPPSASPTLTPNASRKSNDNISAFGAELTSDYRPNATDYAQKATGRSHDYESIEWKILEALVGNKVRSFLSCPPANPATIKSADDTRPKATVNIVDNKSLIPVPEVAPVVASSEVKAEKKHKHRSASTVMTERRLMIAECKAVKAQITKFEQDWFERHQQMPKDSDRGDLEGVYKSYRSMKRGIRSDAAKDIQRYYRGHRVRTQLLLSLHKMPSDVVPMDTASSFESDFMNDSDIEDGDDRRSKRPKDADQHSVESDTYSDEDLLSDKAMGSLTSGISGVGFNLSETDAQSSSRFQELLGLKKEMKAKLKAFDDEFVEARGAMPSKEDKEIMRPYYEQYHDVKAELKKIGSRGYSDNVKAGTARESKSAATGMMTSRSNPMFSSAHHKGDSKRDRRTARPNSANTSSSDNRYASEKKSSEFKSNREDDNLGKLNDEKKQLHLLLKNFEKDFTKTNRRPVMHSEDIKPVAEQYRRYKELKSLTKKKENG